jgi:60 kDa SS-A/Ro ribonucleoprotein
MVNKTLFGSTRGSFVQPAQAKNDAGGAGYELTAEQALAQLAATGCLTDTFYANSEMQLDRVLEACKKVDPQYIARVALYARQKGFMKDMPALLCAILSTRDVKLLSTIFSRVIDNGKMLRNFVQIMRSGIVGRKSLGSRPKKLIQDWLNTVPIKKLIEAYVGNEPSLADIIKMVHPKANHPIRNAFFRWAVGKKIEDINTLPNEIRNFEVWKRLKAQGGTTADSDMILPKTVDGEFMLPSVPFQMLTSLQLEPKDWKAIALDANWHTVRMNLNTFNRHDVFKDQEVVRMLAEKLKDPEVIRKVRVFPYQLYMAYKAAQQTAPHAITEALQDALDVSVENIPQLKGRIAIFVDVSGSMSSAVTGNRGSVTTQVTCREVAGLMAASLVHRNKDAMVVQFSDKASLMAVNPRDSILTNATVITDGFGGGTDCSLPFKVLTATGQKVDLIIVLSDNESWIETRPSQGRMAGNASFIQVGRGSGSMIEYENYRSRVNPACKLVNIDLAPNVVVQAHEVKDRILNVGGFSDEVFKIVSMFMNNELHPNHWVGEINKVDLEQPYIVD